MKGNTFISVNGLLFSLPEEAALPVFTLEGYPLFESYSFDSGSADWRGVPFGEDIVPGSYIIMKDETSGLIIFEGGAVKAFAFEK